MTDNRLPSALPNSVLQSFLKKGFGGIDYPLERPFKQKVFRWIATLNSKLSPIFFFKVFSLFTTLEIFENLFFKVDKVEELVDWMSDIILILYWAFKLDWILKILYKKLFH